MVRLAINGYGRIGRTVLRALQESPHRNALQVVAINELADGPTVAHLTRYDSTHGRFPGQVELHGDRLKVGDHQKALMHQADISQLDWRGEDVDLVLERCTELQSRRSCDSNPASQIRCHPNMACCELAMTWSSS